MRKAVFLDRDGVVSRSLMRNGRPYAPATLPEFEIALETPAALKRLHEAGFLLIIVTNQPDVGHGRIQKETVEAMHELLRQQLPLDDIRVCYSTREEHSPRRKPEPGMLLEAAETWNIDLAGSFMVGDRWSDIEAGKAAGCQTVLIQRYYTERQANDPDHIVSSLEEAAQVILSKSSSPSA